MKKIFYDYGQFDHSFLGISVGLQYQDWILFNKIFGSNDPDYVVKQGDKALKKSKEEAFHFFSTCTSIHHEMRHYYDSLLCPITNHLTRLRILTVINGVQLFPIMSEKIVPVPMLKWQSLSFQEQRESESKYSNFFNKKKFFNYRNLTSDEKQLFDTVTDSYHLINKLLNTSVYIDGIEIRTIHIMESVAVLTQLQAVWEMFGVEHANLLAQHFFSLNTEYTLAIDLLGNVMFKNNSTQDLNIMSCVLHWCLLGYHHIDNDHSDKRNYPVDRFVSILNYFRTNYFHKFETVCDIYEFLDNITGKMPIKDGLALVKKRNNNFLKRIDSIIHSKMFEHIEGYCTRWEDQFLETYNKFTNNHASFVFPFNFISQDSIFEVPNMLVKIYGGLGIIWEKHFDKLFIPLVYGTTDTNDLIVKELLGVCRVHRQCSS